MRWRNPRNRRTGVGILGAAIALPLLALPGADAATSNGSFLIRSTDNEFVGLAGSDASKYQDSLVVPGDSSDPVAGDDVAAALNYNLKCGPLSYTIDQKKLDLALANQKLHDEGKDSQIASSSEGWTGMYSYDPSKGGIVPGFAGENSGFLLTELSSSMTPRSLTEYITKIPPETKVRLYRQVAEGVDYCQIYDLRKAPAAGETYFYYDSKGASYGEGRYEANGSKLYATTVVKYVNGSSSIPSEYFIRYQPDEPGSLVQIKDPSVLADSFIYSSGRKMGTAYYPSTADGYNGLDFDISPQGDTTVSYRLFTLTSDSYTNDGAKRTKGPVSITYDSSGKITALSYYKPSTDTFATLSGASATVANYNSVTGQSWDGSYPKAESYDFEAPFVPSESQ